MMSREKQIEEMAKEICNKCKSDTKCIRKICTMAYREAEHLFNVGYRKQSENIVELPCKIGDKVYSIGRNPDTYEWQIRELSIYRIMITSTGIYLYVSPIIDFHISAIGTRYFFSREDAEKALTKMKGGAE